MNWTGRQVRHDKTGKIPEEFPSLLERLGFSGPDGWLARVHQYAEAVLRKFGAPANQLAELERCTLAGTTAADLRAPALL